MRKRSSRRWVSRFIRSWWKWVILLGYSIAVLWGWRMRYDIFDFMTISKTSLIYPIHKISISALYALIGIYLFVALIKWARAPLILRLLFKWRFEQSGIRNSEGDVPVLISKSIDIRKEHGVIFEFKNLGLSDADLDNKISRLQTVVNGIVYRIAYHERKMNRVFIYVLPKKYAKPKIVSVNSVRLCSEPNLLCVGKTNSGKSYVLATVLGIYARHIPNVSITICDYKKSSFSQFDDTPNFCGYNDVPDGIRAFYREFKARLEANDEERNNQIRVLVIDEYGALVAVQNKKHGAEIKMMVGNMLFMGRSLGIRVLIGVQRADAEHFLAGARDQFRAILAMGNLSKEQKQMLFSDDKEKMTDINDIGEGYLHIDGQDIERVKVAEISDFKALNESIRQAMYH